MSWGRGKPSPFAPSRRACLCAFVYPVAVSVKYCTFCLCAVHSPCAVWGRCDQLCAPANSANVTQNSRQSTAAQNDDVRCSCVSGYRLLPDGHTCRVDSGQYLYIYVGTWKYRQKMTDMDTKRATSNMHDSYRAGLSALLNLLLNQILDLFAIPYLSSELCVYS